MGTKLVPRTRQRGRNRLVRAVARVGLALAVLAAIVLAAEAADPDVPVALSAAAATWIVGNSPFAGVPGLVVHDAELGAQTHAYDLAGRLLVDGVAYVAPSAAHSGRAYAGGPAQIAGLQVTLRYVVDDVYPVLGALATFTNPGPAPVSATVTWENNAGADGATEIATTSSGDDQLTAADRWVVLDDGLAQGGGPATWFHLFGPGDPPLRPSAVFPNTTFFASDEGVRAEYPIEVGPGEAVSLLFLNGLADTTAHGVVLAANADRFLDASLLLDAGVKPEEVKRIVNFELPSLALVPGLSSVAAVLVGLAIVGIAAARGIGRGRGSRVRSDY